MAWDVFLSHASEDKESVVRPLAEALSDEGWAVWYDEYELDVGDSLNRSINEGLSQCDFGVVVLSPHFFAKEWPRRELDGLTARETGATSKIILPVWHDVSASEVARHSPTLADRFAVRTTEGIEMVARKLVAAMLGTQPPQADDHATAVSVRGGSAPEALLSPVHPILALAQDQPVDALEALSHELDIEIRDLASASGHEGVPEASTNTLLSWVVEHGIVGNGLASNYRLLTHALDRLRNADESLTAGQLANVIDALCGLLQVLLVSPTHGYEVAATNVPIYRDPACRDEYPDVAAVVLWELGSHMQHRQYRIYPTRRAYHVGQIVGWQWSGAKGWGDAWWNDDLGEGGISLAWSASLEFVGRPLLRQPAA